MQQAAATQEDAHRAPLFSTGRGLMFVIAVVVVVVPTAPFLATAFDLVIDPRFIILPATVLPPRRVICNIHVKCRWLLRFRGLRRTLRVILYYLISSMNLNVKKIRRLIVVEGQLPSIPISSRIIHEMLKNICGTNFFYWSMSAAAAGGNR